jgi:leader peptidase (prepilin peptidase) / N-methyltransferase
MTTPSPAAAGDVAATAATAATASVMVVASLLAGPTASIAGALVVGTVAATIDARTGRLPNRVVALVALAAVVGVVGAPTPGRAASAAVAGAALLAGPLFVAHVAAPVAIGFGDVKLAAALGAAIGPLGPRRGLVALCIATGATAVAGLATGRRELPLGPGLVLGAAVAVALGGRAWA